MKMNSSVRKASSNQQLILHFKFSDPKNYSFIKKDPGRNLPYSSTKLEVDSRVQLFLVGLAISDSVSFFGLCQLEGSPLQLTAAITANPQVARQLPARPGWARDCRGVSRWCCHMPETRRCYHVP